MDRRNFVLSAAVVLIAALAVLTTLGAINNGVSGLVILSLIILAVLGFGVIGALTEKRDE